MADAMVEGGFRDFFGSWSITVRPTQRIKLLALMV